MKRQAAEGLHGGFLLPAWQNQSMTICQLHVGLEIFAARYRFKLPSGLWVDYRTGNPLFAGMALFWRGIGQGGRYLAISPAKTVYFGEIKDLWSDHFAN
ncbi:hypothetical protein DVH26_08595 [Paenibacillus sp. H1-7]|uniref:hypothetical protein n=1 Tax=Paenibacillus sp. H1-7 TaxID=2282849 RepID=UPI001EF76278|nr:hypothetical protein [Paenibacillus sp. H1-7]ULL14500.1 hypothetical protein DVH26_08595 [Paenibacillus sp. H1-7]